MNLFRFFQQPETGSTLSHHEPENSSLVHKTTVIMSSDSSNATSGASQRRIPLLKSISRQYLKNFIKHHYQLHSFFHYFSSSLYACNAKTKHQFAVATFQNTNLNQWLYNQDLVLHLPLMNVVPRVVFPLPSLLGLKFNLPQRPYIISGRSASRESIGLQNKIV